MKRAVIAAIVALAGAALAQSVGTNSQTGAPDAGYVQNAQNAPGAGDAGPTNNATPAAQSGQQTEIYSFDPPPVGQYSFSVSTPPKSATSR
jgi:hypothetical protein